MKGQLTRRLLTIEEYHAMARAGILAPGEKVELINGEIINMSPIGKRHAYTVDRLNMLIIKKIGDQAVIRIQNPISIGDHSEPEPDVAVVTPPINRYKDEHPQPKDILLLIEVSDSSWAFDSSVKLPLYAKAGIPEVWLINLNNGEIEAHSKPKDGRYSNFKTFKEDDALSLPGFPLSLTVKEILG